MKKLKKYTREKDYISQTKLAKPAVGKEKPARYPVAPLKDQEFEKSIEDQNANEIKKDGIVVAHSKNIFASLMATNEKFSEGVSFDNFKLIFDRLRNILDRKE